MGLPVVAGSPIPMFSVPVWGTLSEHERSIATVSPTPRRPAANRKRPLLSMHEE